jgi:predicted DNA-binding transcriptional regulator YafY
MTSSDSGIDLPGSTPLSPFSVIFTLAWIHDETWHEFTLRMGYAAGMRASRLITLLLMLQTRGRVTARQLADELEVSIRTVYRDIDELSASGIPVFADRGTHGGYQLVEGYRTRLTGLTPDEAESLFLSGYPGPAAQLGLGTVLAAAQLKVLAALPPELRGRASRLRQRFHLDAPGWFQEPDSAPTLPQLAEAVWSDRRLEIRYRRGRDDGPIVKRALDPIGLVLKAGIWYLVGRADDSMRTYRVSRILDLELLPDRFERPEEFDLAEYWGKSVAAYQESLPTFTAKVRVRGEGLERVIEALGPAAVGKARPDPAGPDPGGWVTVSVKLEDLSHAEPIILRIGADLQVLEPSDLRERIAATTREMAALYP